MLNISAVLRAWEQEDARTHPDGLFAREAGIPARQLIELLMSGDHDVTLSVHQVRDRITIALGAGEIIRVKAGPATEYLTPARVEDVERALGARSDRLRALGARAEALGLPIVFRPTADSSVITSIESGFDVEQLVYLLEGKS